jgi:hypothetical protein
MPPARLRFTIRSLMIAVAIVAGLLALSLWPEGFAVAFGLLYLSQIAVLWSMFRGYRRLSAFCFGLEAAVANAWCAVCCIYLLSMGGLALMFVGWFLAFPFLLGIGAAWATAATRRSDRARRSPLLAGPLVLAAAFAPLSMLLTPWPLRLAFLASQAAMERLADRVAAGQAVTSPEWAGLFRVVGSAVDPASGNIGLVIDPNPAGRSGFVRLSPTVEVNGPIWNDRPFVNLNVNEHLIGRWWYQNED